MSDGCLQGEGGRGGAAGREILKLGDLRKSMREAKSAGASVSVPIRDMKPELRQKYRDLCSP